MTAKGEGMAMKELGMPVKGVRMAASGRWCKGSYGCAFAPPSMYTGWPLG